MLRKISFAAVLMSIAGVASAAVQEQCTIQWLFGFFPYEQCTPIVQVIQGACAAPEIDAASAVGALTLMVGAILVLRGGRAKNSEA